MKNLTLSFLLGFILPNLGYSQSISEKIKLEIHNELELAREQQQTFSRYKSGGNNQIFDELPTVNWAKSFGGSGFDNVSDLILDINGNIYLTGYFSGDISVAGNAFSSIGYRDGFIAKFSSAGEYLWFTALPAAQKEIVESAGVYVDDIGNVFATGRYTGEPQIGGVTLSRSNSESLFFVKLNSSGMVQLAKQVADARGLNLAVDASNNIFIVGSTDQSSRPDHSSILLKYDASGSQLFNQKHDEGYSDLVIDETGIYLAGTWHSGVDGVLDDEVSLVFDNDNVLYYFAYVAKMSQGGDFEWATIASHSQEGAGGTSKGVSIAVDGADNLIVGGTYEHNITLGSSSLITSYRNSSFVAKVSLEGTIMFAQDTNMNDGKGLISVDNSGNVFTFDGTTLVEYDNTLKQQSRSEQNWGSLVSVSQNGTKAVIAGLEDQSVIIRQVNLANNNQDFESVFDGNTAATGILAVEMDRNNNIYSTGYTSSATLVFGEEIDRGYFLSKQNQNGELLWIKNFKCEPNNVNNGNFGNVLTLSRDEQSLYAFLGYKGDMNLPDGSSYSSTNGAFMIVKYDLDGSLDHLIEEKFNATNPQIRTDYEGNLLISGEAINVTNLVGGQSFHDIGDGSHFLIKYDNEGKVLFVKNIGQNGVAFSMLVDADADNNIYLNSEMDATSVTINKVEVLTKSAGDGRNVMIKLNTSGSLIWAKVNGGDKDPEKFDEYYTWTTGLVVDPQGNMYIKGSLGKTAYFDEVFLNNPDNRYNKFIAKFTKDGETLWAKAISQSSGTNYCFDYNELEVDELGNVYFGSQYQGVFTFDNGTKLESEGNKNLFIAKYTGDGSLDWVKSWAVENYSNRSIITGIGVNQSQQIVIGGRFEKSVSADDMSLFSNLIDHGFLFAIEDITAHYIPLSISDLSSLGNMNLFPNPAENLINFYIKDKKSLIEVEIVNTSGQRQSRVELQGEALNSIDVSSLKPGFYILKFQSDLERWSQPFVKK